MLIKDNTGFIISFEKLLLFNIIILILIFIFYSHTSAGYEEPWEVDNKVYKYDHKDIYEGNLLKLSLTIAVRFFQKVVSPVDGDKCPMYPTCSEYSIQALKKHGAFIGFMMTADRLIHESEEQKHARVIFKYGHARFLDTLEDNNFWWYKNEAGDDKK